MNTQTLTAERPQAGGLAGWLGARVADLAGLVAMVTPLDDGSEIDWLFDEDEANPEPDPSQWVDATGSEWGYAFD